MKALFVRSFLWISQGFWLLALFAFLVAQTSSTHAQTSGDCTGSLDWILGTNLDNQGANCSGYRCYPPVAAEVVFEPAAGCNPALGPCSITATVDLTFPGNHQNDPAPFGFTYSFATVEVRDSFNSLLGACGHAGQLILEDTGSVQWGFTGACGDTDVAFEVRARSCPCQGPFCPLCQHVTTVTADLNDSNLCPEPPKEDCPGADSYSCNNCLGVGPGGAPPGGGGGGFGGGPDGEAGPGARLAYKAGGAGHPGWPGTASWLPTLGRYWSHDYAQRIIPDPDDGHVWLITDRATFREFSNLSGGTYQTNSPTDEYRTLRKVGSGWELTDLDGMVMAFDAAGRWISTTDRFGNPKMGSYNGLGQLEQVSFADQRTELFTYDAVTGKLDTLTEVGVGGSPSRTWSYTWDGDDLERIDLPDGRAYEFFYEDLLLPGYLTRVELVGTEGGREVKVAWEYDASGNVGAIWRGDASKSGPDAVDLWELGYDDPALPVMTTVIDPLGAASTYTFGRDEGSRKARLEELSGSCPACAVAPNSVLAYNDPDHPLRPTRKTNARGIHTDFTYDEHGQVITRTEASGTSLERTITWTYHSNFPRLITEIEQPSVAGGASVRTTTMVYNTEGALEERRIEGSEAPGGAFSNSTFYTPSDEGLPEVVDPPGYGSTDLTTNVYDATRGLLLPESRTDPIIGTTTFSYDGYNRRTGVTDPNGVTTTTAYDEADRITFVTQEGATPAEDLVTEHRYDQFGRLFQTVLPKGNFVEYGYDAAGRLISIERKPNDQTGMQSGSHGERTLYTLDAAGNRTREEQQRWDGAGWVTESFADYTWANRCQMEAMDHADGSRTEYAYDCEGNLEKVWDANHPSLGQTEIPTVLYSYDVLDRLEAVTQRWGGDPGFGMFAVTEYGYDVQDHLTRITDAEGSETTYVYSDRDLLTEEVSPVSGTTTHGYSERGELEETTDARGIVTTRTLDELDRMTFVDYPDDSLDITYTYDDPLVPFSKGRLTAITRNSESLDYRYDRFGRLTQDGALGYAYDANGNRSAVEYPGSVTAAYAHDYADRPESLTVQRPGEPDLLLADGAEYAPSGPLKALDLGNGLTETRSFTDRYFPSAITVAPTTPLIGAPIFQWAYTTDNVGNIVGIQDGLTPANDKDYGYQDFQYYLTVGDGPWGDLAWTYDRIGNRLTETRDGVTDTYAYQLNDASGNTAILGTITLGVTGTKTYTYGPAGHLEQVTAPASETTFHSDAAGRLTRLERPAGDAVSDFLYDGRSFLKSAEASSLSEIFVDGFEAGDGSCWTSAVGSDIGAGTADCSTVPSLTSFYSSEGVLHATTHFTGPTEQSTRYYFYFAGRPMAQMDLPVGGSAEVTWLSVDHLGTPVLATDAAGSVLWQGGFEPFGADYSGASAAGVDLRFPGQWVDEVWRQASLSVPSFYNLHRWYGSDAGRYTRADPADRPLGVLPYGYSNQRPTGQFDPLGLVAVPPIGGPSFIDPPMESGFECVARIRDQVRRDGAGRTRYQHCLANCLISKQCPGGRTTAIVASLVKEAGDLGRCLIQRRGGNCNSAFQPDDFADNETGRLCRPEVPCHMQCEGLRTAEEPQPGPFGGLSPGERSSDDSTGSN